jgi:hypothetical protein
MNVENNSDSSGSSGVNSSGNDLIIARRKNENQFKW